MSPSPDTSHQRIVLNIAALFARYLERHPVGEVLIAPLDVYLSDVNVLQPDVIFVSNQRRKIITDHGVEGAPDFVAEILSPSSARYDKGSKRKIYARAGVKELWLVDPAASLIHAYFLANHADAPIATYGANAIFKSSLFPRLRIHAATVFKSPAATQCRPK